MRAASTWISPLIAAAIVVFGALPAQAAEPPITSTGQNLPALDGATPYQAGPGPAEQIRAYRSSGRWAADTARIASQAGAFLSEWLGTCRLESSCRPAVVFDIDETLLTSYATYNRADFAPSPTQRARARDRCLQSRIGPVVRLYEQAREKGAAIFIVTGRSEKSRAVTNTCLRKRGISGWTQLIMRSAAQGPLTAAAYKAQARGALEAQGYDIAFSIGDQFSDVTGGHFAHGYVLPDPMTFLP